MVSKYLIFCRRRCNEKNKKEIKEMITLHFQYLDGDYDEIMVEETDEQKIKIIHENNNIIRRKKYLKDKYESKFTI